MSKFYLNPEDVVFLRGAQEEMFLKLLQLQTAPNPNEILLWMYEHGVNKTIDSYGLDSKQLIDILFFKMKKNCFFLLTISLKRVIIMLSTQTRWKPMESYFDV